MLVIALVIECNNSATEFTSLQEIHASLDLCYFSIEKIQFKYYFHLKLDDDCGKNSFILNLSNIGTEEVTETFGLLYKIY